MYGMIFYGRRYLQKSGDLIYLAIPKIVCYSLKNVTGRIRNQFNKKYPQTLTKKPRFKNNKRYDYRRNTVPLHWAKN